MAQQFDAIVLGAGGMGSAAAYYLATSGQKVLLLDQDRCLHFVLRTCEEHFCEHREEHLLVSIHYHYWIHEIRGLDDISCRHGVTYMTTINLSARVNYAVLTQQIIFYLSRQLHQLTQVLAESGFACL